MNFDSMDIYETTRQDRLNWCKSHNTHNDPICKKELFGRLC